MNINEKFLKRIEKNINLYEPYYNVGLYKSMIQIKLEMYKSDVKKNINFLIDIAINNLILSTIKKNSIVEEVNINELKEYMKDFKYIFCENNSILTDLKRFKVHGLNDDIYLSNLPIIDLRSVKINTLDCLKEEYVNLYDVNEIDNLPNEYKKTVFTFNCIIGDVKLVKIKI